MSASSAPKVKAFLGSGIVPAYSFVKFGATKDVVTACGLNERAIGIAQNSAASVDGDVLEVALMGGGAKLKCSEAIALGKMLTSSAGGLAKVANAAGEWIGAIAFEDGVLNDIIGVEVVGFQAVASDV